MLSSLFALLGGQCRIPGPAAFMASALAIVATSSGIFLGVPTVVSVLVLILVWVAIIDVVVMIFLARAEASFVSLRRITDTTPMARVHLWALMVLAGSIVPPVWKLVAWSAWTLLVAAVAAVIVTCLGMLWRRQW